MKSLIVLGILLSFSGCASIPDARICTPLTRGRGWCGHILSNKEKTYSRQEWAKLNLKMLRMPVKDFGSVKKYIIKQCLRNKTCKNRHKLRIEDRLNRM